jgi:hypothetical protein
MQTAIVSASFRHGISMVSSISPAVLVFIGVTAFMAASVLLSARPRRILQVTHNQQ